MTNFENFCVDLDDFWVRVPKKGINLLVAASKGRCVQHERVV